MTSAPRAKRVRNGRGGPFDSEMLAVMEKAVFEHIEQDMVRGLLLGLPIAGVVEWGELEQLVEKDTFALRVAQEFVKARRAEERVNSLRLMLLVDKYVAGVEAAQHVSQPLPAALHQLAIAELHPGTTPEEKALRVADIRLRVRQEKAQAEREEVAAKLHTLRQGRPLQNTRAVQRGVLTLCGVDPV